MPSVRIWTLDSAYDARAVRSLAEKLAIHFQLDRLSIQTSGKGALPKPNRIGNSPHEMLRKAVRNYLKQDDCVIFVIDSDGPMSSHQRRQEPNSLINQIMQIVRDSSFDGRVYFVPAVHELESWLLIDCLGISCCFASKRRPYRENCRQKLMSAPLFSRLVRKHQRGDTEKIVEAVAGGRGAKEYLIDFSEQILLGLNPNMPQKNIKRERYREAMAPEIAEHLVINQQTLERNASLRRLGNYLARVI